MSAAAPILDTQQMPPFPVHRFTVPQYRRLCESGVLEEDDRVELLEGWIVSKMTHNPPHDVSVKLTGDACTALLSEDWQVRIQSAVNTDDSEPEPDVAIVKAPVRRYIDHHPQGDEIALLVEVSDTSLAKDRRKAETYARAGVPVYWIVNLPERQLEVYTDPDSGRYASMVVYAADDVAPLVVAGRTMGDISVADILP